MYVAITLHSLQLGTSKGYNLKESKLLRVKFKFTLEMLQFNCRYHFKNFQLSFCHFTLKLLNFELFPLEILQFEYI